MGSTEDKKSNSFNQLVAINRAISNSLDFDEVLGLIVSNAADLVSAETSLMILADEEGVWRVRAAHGDYDERIERFSGQMEESIIEDLTNLLITEAEKHLITLPIVVSGSLNGMLAIVRASELAQEEYWHLSALADQAAIALNNARLHELETGAALRARDQSLAALRESNRKISNILESITDLFYQVDRHWRLINVNKRAEELFGRSRSELIGQVIWNLYPAQVSDTLRNQFFKARSERLPVHFEVEGGLSPGIWFEAHVYPSETSLSVYLREITERKRAEEEIRFRAHLLNSVEQAVIATDLNGKIIYWNQFAEWVYGWEAHEALGKNILEVTPAEGSREKAKEVLDRLREGRSWSGEFLVKKKDGTLFPAQVTDSPIFSESGELIGVVGVSVDISERKRAEEERTQLLESERLARNEAEKANALKDEFLATLSHELRNPLNVILGYCEVLLRSQEVRQSPFLARAAETVKRNAIAQSQLISDLLDLSRLRMGKVSFNLGSVSFTATINNAIESVQAEALAKKISIHAETPNETLSVRADPLRLEQVVWNLLNNAVKFTPPGGNVQVNLKTEGDDAILVIADDGEGIDPEFLPRVFEMFRQADPSNKRKHGGMGIGLALVRRLVELQGGAVAAASEGKGKGATFTVRIPLSREAKPDSAGLTATGRAVLNNLRILIVDDSRDTIDMLHHLLEMEGARVTSARTGAEALQIAAESEFDLIISDISMPEMDGFELLRRLRKIPLQQDAPVVALTGFGRPEDTRRVAAEGFFSHVTKPLDVDHLLQMLQNLPQRKRELGIGN